VGSSYDSAGWLRRLWSLASPGTPSAEFVANVNIVNDRGYSSSRERAPYAVAALNIAAAAAGEHSYIEIGGTDAFSGSSPIILLHQAGAQIAAGLNMLWAAPNAITTATTARTAVALATSDQDPDLTPTLFRADVATANIPAAAALFPGWSSAGTAVDATFWLNSHPGLRFAQRGRPGQSLYLIAGNNAAVTFYAVWQAMRS